MLEPQLLLVDKPVGVTSHDVVAVLRAAFRTDSDGPFKIGHAGTLDPFASGLLLVLIGPAVKAQAIFMDSMKSYEAVIQLGTQTDTGDHTGQVVATKIVGRLAPTDLAAASQACTGKMVQPVPLYAAAKVAGKKLYEYARAGSEPPVRPIRVCTIIRLQIKAYNAAAQTLSISVDCSAGTYIRALAEQLAQKLGTVGHLAALRRTASGQFSVTEAVAIDYLFRSLREGSV